MVRAAGRNQRGLKPLCGEIGFRFCALGVSIQQLPINVGLPKNGNPIYKLFPKRGGVCNLASYVLREVKVSDLAQNITDGMTYPVRLRQAKKPMLTVCANGFAVSALVGPLRSFRLKAALATGRDGWDTPK